MYWKWLFPIRRVNLWGWFEWIARIIKCFAYFNAAHITWIFNRTRMVGTIGKNFLHGIPPSKVRVHRGVFFPPFFLYVVASSSSTVCLARVHASWPSGRVVVSVDDNWRSVRTITSAGAKKVWSGRRRLFVWHILYYCCCLRAIGVHDNNMYTLVS